MKNNIKTAAYGLAVSYLTARLLTVGAAGTLDAIIQVTILAVCFVRFVAYATAGICDENEDGERSYSSRRTHRPAKENPEAYRESRTGHVA